MPVDSKSTLRQMCSNTLTKADRRAIGKCRGFSSKEINSPALFENFFLSETGVATALAELETKEIMLLHWLLLKDDIVDITVFSRIYGGDRKKYYDTFTQKYKEIFDQIRQRLVRSGILLWEEERYKYQGKTKMERHRFTFPPEFARHLPPLLGNTLWLEDANSQAVDGFRQNLIRIMKAKPAPTRRNKQYELELRQGNLLIGGKPFSTQALLEWQLTGWEDAAYKKQTKKKPKYRPQYNTYRPSFQAREISPVEMVVFALSRLGKDEWAKTEALTPFLDLCYDNIAHPAAQLICETGWEWGCLMKTQHQGADYFRLKSMQPVDSESIEPSSYLDMDSVINVEAVPYTALEILVQVGDFEVHGSRLFLLPSLVKMGNTTTELRNHPIILWLGENNQDFAESLSLVNEQWGKITFHDNLLFARVTDLSLRVQLEKVFKDGSVIFLPEGWLAFPVMMEVKVARAVEKAGHVVKRVNANE
jgi:hypothetical protein